MDVPPTRRIVLLGKTGAGKSSFANTLFGETMFQMSHSPLSQTSVCQAQSKLINGRLITLIDTPGFFDTGRSEEDMKPNILQCIVECAPGPHAFIIMLKVEKFTDHEKAVIKNMFQYFSEEVLRYATILFTHGDQLQEEMKIQEFVSQSECLVDLLQKCGGRCHVIDNKYWNNEPKNEYRSNKFQVEELLNTIDNIVMENKGGYYTNELLQAVESEIQKEEERIRQASGTVSQEEARKKAKSAVFKQNVAKFARIAGKGLLIAALLGGFEFVGILALAIKGVGTIRQAVRKRRPAIDPVSKEETATGVTVGTAEGKATTQAASTPNEPAPTKEPAVEKAKTASDVLSKLVKFFRTSKTDTKESAEGEVSTSETNEAATMEEEVGDGSEELVEGAPGEETGTAEVLPTTETDVAAEEEGEIEQPEVEMTQEVTISTTGETPEVAMTAEEAAGGEAVAVEEGASAVTGTFKHAAEEGAAEGTAALTTAVKEEVDGVVVSAAEAAANEVALAAAAGGAVSVTAAVEGLAEASVEGVDVAAVAEGAAEVVAEAIEGVANVVDVVAKVAETCCIQ